MNHKTSPDPWLFKVLTAQTNTKFSGINDGFPSAVATQCSNEHCADLGILISVRYKFHGMIGILIM